MLYLLKSILYDNFLYSPNNSIKFICWISIFCYDFFFICNKTKQILKKSQIKLFVPALFGSTGLSKPEKNLRGLIFDFDNTKLFLLNGSDVLGSKIKERQYKYWICRFHWLNKRKIRGKGTFSFTCFLFFILQMRNQWLPILKKWTHL